MNSALRHQLDELREKRIENEKAILWDYYKRAHHMTNEDARGAVANHFQTNPVSIVGEKIFKATEHWNDLNNERETN